MSKKKKNTNKLVKTGVGNIVGIALIGATSSMHNSMPAGTAKTITGIVPGLQAVALVGNNLKPLKVTKRRKKKK